jgi:hypothetical protein
MTPHPGWSHSPETRARLSAAHVGKRHSAATRRKISEGQRGKMSEAHIARRPPNLPLREVQRLEARRRYKRALRERRRTGSYIRRYKEKT